MRWFREASRIEGPYPDFKSYKLHRLQPAQDTTSGVKPHLVTPDLREVLWPVVGAVTEPR